MRITRIILIFFCLFILKGYNHAFAKKHAHPYKGFPVQIIEDKNSLVFNNSQDHNTPAICSLDDEDDDNDFTSAKKKILVAGLFTVHSIVFKNPDSNLSSNKKRFYERFYHLSHDLYIFQRVLRV